MSSSTCGDCAEFERVVPILEKQNAELLQALKELADCSPCQNACEPDDMSCASNVARAAIAKAEGTECDLVGCETCEEKELKNG